MKYDQQYVSETRRTRARKRIKKKNKCLAPCMNWIANAGWRHYSDIFIPELFPFVFIFVCVRSPTPPPPPNPRPTPPPPQVRCMKAIFLLARACFFSWCWRSSQTVIYCDVVHTWAWACMTSSAVFWHEMYGIRWWIDTNEPNKMREWWITTTQQWDGCLNLL